MSFGAQCTVMVCVQHVLPHHKFCCSSVNISQRVCAEKAHLLWIKWTSETVHKKLCRRNGWKRTLKKAEGMNINEGIFVVTTPNLQKTHSRAREGCGSLSSTLLMDVGELGARSRTPHCAQQRLCYHCCLQTASFRQWRVKRAQWEDKFGLSEPSSTWCCLAWCFTGNPLHIFLPLRIDIWFLCSAGLDACTLTDGGCTHLPTNRTKHSHTHTEDRASDFWPER